MLNNKDIAIKENIAKPKTVDTFMRNVYIRKPDDALIANSPEEFLRQIYDPCHIWQGFKTKRGYGYFSVYSKEVGNRLSVKAHRFAYALHYGFDALPPSPEQNSMKALILNHLCHNRSCVNPLHLEVITAKENLSDEKRATNV